MPTFRSLSVLALSLALFPAAFAKAPEAGAAKASPLASLPFRALGPAVTSGRVGDIALDPRKHDTLSLIHI